MLYNETLLIMKSVSKKRAHENSMEEGINTKKVQPSGENTFHLKLLIPSVAAGAIIGKGGETIAEIQKNVGARVKMSKANDFYPGTNERVCLITGSKEAITDICCFLAEKVKEKPDPNAKPAIDFDNKVTADRDKQMKVIVPNSTAGMIIGKGGSYIKHLKESSGSFIQLSQKAKDTTLPERVVTVIGEEDNNKVALEMILDKVQEDPQSGSCLNISYSDMTGPVANFNPTGSPFANGGSPPSESICQAENQNNCAGFNLNIPGYSSLNIKLNFQSSQPPTDPRIINQCLPHVNHSFRRSGYSEKVADELTRAMGTLSMHGVLQLTPTNPEMSSDPVFLPPPPQTPPHPANQGPFGPAGLVPAPPERPPPNAFHRSTSPGPLALPPAPFHSLPVNNNSFGLATAGNPLPPPPPPGLEEQLSKIEIEVNESLVGAVLGPAGRSIVEIQQFSGANIQISKKGTYSPGTRNRIVTITGPQKCLNTAQFLIEQRVQDEEAKRQLNTGNANKMGIGL